MFVISDSREEQRQRVKEGAALECQDKINIGKMMVYNEEQLNIACNCFSDGGSMQWVRSVLS